MKTIWTWLVYIYLRHGVTKTGWPKREYYGKMWVGKQSEKHQATLKTSKSGSKVQCQFQNIQTLHFSKAVRQLVRSRPRPFTRCLPPHGCQMTIAIFLDCMCLALRASGLWFRYATLQNVIPSFPWIAPRPSTLAQSKERKGSHFAILQPCPSLVRSSKCSLLPLTACEVTQRIQSSHKQHGRTARTRTRGAEAELSQGY